MTAPRPKIALKWWIFNSEERRPHDEPDQKSNLFVTGRSESEMFDQEFVEEMVDRIAEAVVRRLPGPKVAQRYMKFEQAGEYIGVTEESVRYYVNQGWLPVTSKGAKRWIDKEDIDRFMATNKRYIKVPVKPPARAKMNRAA